MKDVYWLLLIFGLLLLYPVGRILRGLFDRYQELQETYRMVVRETSARCLALERLNAEFVFCNVMEASVFSVSLDSKAKFDRFQLYSLFLTSIEQNRVVIEQNAVGAATNRRLYAEYMKCVQSLPQYSDKEVALAELVPFRKYSCYEEERFRELLQKPVCYYRVICEKRYSSPQGRNNYKLDVSYTEADIEKGFQELSRAKQEQHDRLRSAEYQRRLVTAKVRYAVLQRDQFRCVLCGRGASTVELEVDHIKPVSRGGTSDMTNLRTLCRDCNRGKGASWQESGNN